MVDFIADDEQIGYSRFTIYHTYYWSSMVKISAGTARGARGREYKIDDRDDLASLLDEAIAKQYRGIRLAAAKAVGIPNSTLQRYVEKKGDGMRTETFLKLERLVGPAGRERLDSTVSVAGTDRLLSIYRGWVEEEIEGILLGRRGSHHLLTNRFHDDDGTFEMRKRHVLRHKEAMDSLLFELRGKKFSKEWKPLEARIVDRGHTRRRARLAYLRVVEPLRDNFTNGLDRDSFTERELRVFISAGVKRERILLDRDADMRRAQVVLAEFWGDTRPIKTKMPGGTIGGVAGKEQSRKESRRGATPVPPKTKTSGRKSPGRSRK